MFNELMFLYINRKNNTIFFSARKKIFYLFSALKLIN